MKGKKEVIEMIEYVNESIDNGYYITLKSNDLKFIDNLLECESEFELLKALFINLELDVQQELERDFIALGTSIFKMNKQPTFKIYIDYYLSDIDLERCLEDGNYRLIIYNKLNKISTKLNRFNKFLKKNSFMFNSFYQALSYYLNYLVDDYKGWQ